MILWSFLAIFHAAVVFGLASLPGIARHACAALVTTLFATVRLLRLRSNSSAASHTTNQQSYCDDAHFIALLFVSIRHLRALGSKLAVQVIDISPPDGVHKRIDVSGRLGAKVLVIGMLIHIERQNRRSPC